MRTYRELFRRPGVHPAVRDQLGPGGRRRRSSGLALGTLVYAATGSPLLSALSHVRPLAGPAHRGDHAAVGGRPAAAAGRDGRRGAGLRARHRRRWPCPACRSGPASRSSSASGLVASLGGGVRYGLLNEILPPRATCWAARCSTCPSAPCRSAGSRSAACWWPRCRRAARCWRARPCTWPPRSSPGSGLSRAPAAGRRPAVGRARPGGTTPGCGPPAAPLRLPRAVGAERADRRLRVALRPLRAAARGTAVRLRGRSACWPGTPLTGRFVPARLAGRLGAPLRLLLAAPYLIFAAAPGAAARGRRRRRSPRSATRPACCSRSG